MKFGVSLPNNQGVPRMSKLVDLAVAAEDSGFDSVWVSEHLFHATYVAARLENRPYHEPLTLLAAVAMKTARVKLGTSVLVLPWHHPVNLAKTIAAIDDLSDGRVILGVGVAQTEDEFENLGIEFKRRGAIADDCIRALQALWTMDVPEYKGTDYAFSGLRMEPKPVQKPHPPLYIGGNSKAALRRLARFGDGWHPLSLSANEIAKVRQSLRPDLPVVVRAVTEVKDESWERPVGDRRTFKGTVDELRDMVSAYEAAGVTEIIVDAATRDLDHTRRLWQQLEPLFA